MVIYVVCVIYTFEMHWVGCPHNGLLTQPGTYVQIDVDKNEQSVHMLLAIKMYVSHLIVIYVLLT